MDGKTARNMYSADNSKEHFISCISLVIQNTNTNNWFINLKERSDFEDRGLGRSIILKFFLNKVGGYGLHVDWMHLTRNSEKVINFGKE